jgi:NodT family efflux transporter outer membrane factor (OMF) lipoprotein
MFYSIIIYQTRCMAMIARVTLVLLGSIALSACAGHPSPPPEVALAPSFRATALETAGLKAAAVERNWWRAFGDPTLDRVVEQALLSNLDIEAAAARLQQAAGASRVARSNQLPSGTLGGSAATQRQSLNDPLARIASAFPDYDRTSSLYGLSAAASWELDLFGRVAAGRRAAVADQEAAAAQLDDARLTVAAEIATAYITARELQARRQIARTRIDTNGQIQALVARRFTEGSASRFERDQADADLAGSRAGLAPIEAALDETYNRIDLLSGRAPGHAAALLGEGTIPSALAVTTQDGPAGLLVRRPDIHAAQRRLAAADARVAEALTAYYPRLSIQGLVGLLSSDWSDLFSDDAVQSTGSATVSGRLFDFGAARGGVEGARGRTQEAAALYKATVLRAAGEAEDAFSSVSRRNRHAIDLADSRSALTSARDTALTAYNLGGLSLKDALDVQRRLLDVEEASATAQADATRASVTLFRVLGGGWSSSLAWTS